jgi:FkbM family methyltransferase
MIKPLLALYRLARTFRQINRLPLGKDLRNRIRQTYLRVFFLRQYDAQNRVANIVGNTVQYCRYESLAYSFNEIFLNAEYHFETEESSPFIIDCGSNIGISVLYFKILYPGAEIVAFEPSNDAYECLRTNVAKNALTSVTVNNKALSANDGDVEFYYDIEDPGSLGMSTVQERTPRQKLTVEAVRLSKFIEKEVDFLKIDVEGAERDIIEELSRARKLNHIQQMVIEYHHHIRADEDVFSQTLRLLESAGFGYQIESRLNRPFEPKQFQDVIVYAYRKERYSNSPVDRGYT